MRCVAPGMETNLDLPSAVDDPLGGMALTSVPHRDVMGSILYVPTSAASKGADLLVHDGAYSHKRLVHRHELRYKYFGLV